MDASRVLLVSGVVQATVCGLDYAQLMQPLALSLQLSSPFLVCRFLQDALILPYWVTSIGRATGQTQEARRAYSCAGLGNLFQIAAVWCDAWDLSKWFLMPAALCIGMASYRVLQYDEGIPSKVRSDMQSSGYLLVFYMLSGFIVEVLGVSHEIGEEQMLLEYAVVDVLGKVPSCHLFTRSLAGSQFVLRETNTRGRLDIAAIDFEDDDDEDSSYSAAAGFHDARFAWKQDKHNQMHHTQNVSKFISTKYTPACNKSLQIYRVVHVFLFYGRFSPC